MSRGIKSFVAVNALKKAINLLIIVGMLTASWPSQVWAMLSKGAVPAIAEAAPQQPMIVPAAAPRRAYVYPAPAPEPQGRTLETPSAAPLTNSAAVTDSHPFKMFLPLISRTSFTLVEAPVTAAGGVIVVPPQGSTGGVLTLDFAPGAVGETYLIRIGREPGSKITGAIEAISVPVALTSPLLPLQWFELEARRPGENDPVDLQFQAPVTLTYTYNVTEVEGLNPHSLTFGYMPPLSATLQPIPSSVVTRTETRAITYPDPDSGEIVSDTLVLDVPVGQVTTVITHLSTYGITGDKAAWATPALDAFEVVLAKGQSSYSYDLPVPAGPNGFAPKLTLQYSSGTPNGMVGRENFDSGWVGVGWSLDVGFINETTVSVNGVQERIAWGRDGRIHTQHENYMNIQRLANNSSWCLDDTWVVTDRQGTKYYFGDGNVQSSYRADPARWECGEYKLYKVMDVHSNTMTISYQKITGIRSWSYRELYPQRIAYTTNPAAGDNTAEYEIYFDIERKSFGDVRPLTERIASMGEHWYKLRQIRMYYQGEPIRNLVFSLNIPAGDHIGYQLDALRALDSNNQEIVPPMTFSYSHLDTGYRQTRNGNKGWKPVFERYQRPFLTGVNNGSGGAISFEYTPYLFSFTDRDGNTSTLPLFQIVAKRHVHDAVTGSDSVYFYNYNLQGNEVTVNSNENSQYSRNIAFFGYFNGFAQVDVTDPLGYVNRHYFDNKFGGFRITSILNGRELRTEQRSGNQLLSYSVNTWQTRREPTWPEGFAFVFKEKQIDYICGAGGRCDANETRWEYDHLTGNMLAKIEYGDGSNPYRTAQYLYTAPNVHNRTLPYRQILWAGSAGSGQNVGETRYYYDGLPFGQAGIGNLTTRRMRVDVGQYVDATYVYDGYGHVTEQRTYSDYGTDAATGLGTPQITRTSYDDHGLYASEVVNPAGHSQKVAEFDYRFQLPVRELDANNAQTRYEYDSLGRISQVWLPACDGDPGFKAEYYNYAGATSPYREVAWQRVDDCSGATGAYAATHVFYDGLGRKIQAHTEGDAPGSPIAAYISLDALGRVKYASLPEPLAGTMGIFQAPNWSNLSKTETQYDGLGRVIMVKEPDGSMTFTAYNRRAVGKLDAKGHLRISETDAFGRLVLVKEFGNGKTYSTIPWNDAATATTRYLYDIRGNLTQVQDPSGNPTVLTYNELGQKTVMVDPDMGAWSYAYDPQGNLTAQTDARGVVTHISYDSLGRPTARNYTIPAGLNVVDPGAATYVYDVGGAAANANGRRTQMADTAGQMNWQYDARGRVTAETRTFTGGYTVLDNTGAPGGSAYTTRYAYNAAGAVIQTIYPDGEVVTADYTLRGLPKSLSGAEPYVKSGSVTYDAQTRLTAMTLGNNLSVAYTYYPATQQGGRLRRAVVGGNLLDLTYSYDAVGNLAAITDASASVGGQALSFGYDSLDRLISAQAGEALIAGYQETYAYDKIGNIIQRSDVQAGETLAYTYGQNGAGPHAVTAMNGNLYQYDAAGNMAMRTEDGVVYAQTWTAENKLARVETTPGAGFWSEAVDTRFVYDGDGNRLLKIEIWPASAGSAELTTVYIGGAYERQFNTHGLGAQVLALLSQPTLATAAAVDRPASVAASTTVAMFAPVASPAIRSAGASANLAPTSEAAALMAPSQAQTFVWDSQAEFVNVQWSSQIDRYSVPGSIQILGLDDNFNDNVVNADLWAVPSGYTAFDEVSGHLVGGGRWERVFISKDTAPRLTLDFDVQVDYQLASWDTGVRSQPRLAFALVCENSHTAWMQYAATYTSDGPVYSYESWFLDEGVKRHSVSAPGQTAESQTGSLRMARSGSTWTLYIKYNDPRHPDWQVLDSVNESDIDPRHPFGNCRIELAHLLNGAPAGYTSYVDNLQINTNNSTPYWNYPSSGDWLAEVYGGPDAVTTWGQLTLDGAYQPPCDQLCTSISFCAQSCSSSGGGGECGGWQCSDMDAGDTFVLDSDIVGYYRYLRVQARLMSDFDMAYTPRIDRMSLTYMSGEDGVTYNPNPVTAQCSGSPVMSDTWQLQCRRPTFSWPASADPAGIYAYRLLWRPYAASAPAPGDPGWITLGGAVTAYVAPSELPLNSHYELWMQTVDNLGNASDIELQFIFKYGDKTPPTVPGAIVETHGVESDIWQMGVSTPVFTWTASTDEGLGVVGYDVYWGALPNGDPATAVAIPEFQPGAVVSGTRTYLRVWARDGAGNLSTAPSTFVFKYGADQDPPILGRPVLAASGDADKLYIVSDVTPTLYYSSAAAGVLSVALSACDIPAGLQSVTFPDVFAAGDGGVSALGGQQGPLNLTRSYTFTVGQAVNGMFTIVVSDTNANVAVAAFRIVHDAIPPDVSVTAPPQPGLAIPVSWSGHDSLSGVRHYQVQVQANGGAWSTWLTQTAAIQATFVATAAVSYRFRVQATDNVGNPSGWAYSESVEGAPVRKYYTFNAQRVAMRQGTVTRYLASDRLGSVSLAMDGSGAVMDERRYLPYGQERWTKGAAVSDFGFTGQRNEAGFGLMDYNARYYSPLLGRFISADTYVPEPGKSQGWNRYAYVHNNPLSHVDPSGHCTPGVDCPEDLPVTQVDPDQSDDKGKGNGGALAGTFWGIAGNAVSVGQTAFSKLGQMEVVRARNYLRNFDNLPRLEDAIQGKTYNGILNQATKYENAAGKLDSLGKAMTAVDAAFALGEIGQSLYAGAQGDQYGQVTHAAAALGKGTTTFIGFVYAPIGMGIGLGDMVATHCLGTQDTGTLIEQTATIVGLGGKDMLAADVKNDIARRADGWVKATDAVLAAPQGLVTYFWGD
ncbi:MAG: hypothetical protein JXA21_18610 [Anaerolineae bacterium]|nr:hypothetical protein [Anaerolineae bacterium]